jgi:hypothetical protein
MFEIGGMAVGALMGMGLAIATVVAPQYHGRLGMGLVVGQGDIAMGAHDHRATATAGDKTTVPPAVNEQ